MARRSRLDLDGFHHIVNRGVARSNIYRCDEDKEKFFTCSHRLEGTPILLHCYLK